MKKRQKSKVNCEISCPKKLRKRGFSLVEVLVAMFIFVLAITMVSGSFAGFLKNYANTKKTQKSVENAQFVMNQMEQAFLNSSHVSIVNGTGQKINDFQLNLYETTNNINKCVVYYFKFSSKSISSWEGDPTTPGDGNTCVFSDINTSNVLIENSVVGFSALGDQVKITLVLRIQEVDQREVVTVQSTALSRNAWINDPACPVSVLANDAGQANWGLNADCTSPHCDTSNKLVSSNKVDFSKFDARLKCQELSGRLPDVGELTCILQNKNIYGGSGSFTDNGNYWTSEESNNPKAYEITNDGTQTSNNANKNTANRIRCVK